MISSNSFSKQAFSTGSGSFTDDITHSSNTMTREVWVKGSNAWGGENTASSAFGNEDVFGGPDSTFGDGVFGGMSHFALRTKPTISH